jgi:hypothetical protein
VLGEPAHAAQIRVSITRRSHVGHGKDTKLTWTASILQYSHLSFSSPIFAIAPRTAAKSLHDIPGCALLRQVEHEVAPHLQQLMENPGGRLSEVISCGSVRH